MYGRLVVYCYVVKLLSIWNVPACKSTNNCVSAQVSAAAHLTVHCIHWRAKIGYSDKTSGKKWLL